jgi:DNA-binding NarL/FixJ family response regulator
MEKDVPVLNDRLEKAGPRGVFHVHGGVNDCYNDRALVLFCISGPPGRSRHFASSLAKLKLRRNCVPPRTEPIEVAFPRIKIRCVLVHDHVLLRQGLRRLLEDEPDLEVVSEAGNAAECLRKVYELRPDVLVADAGTFGLVASEVRLCVQRESPQTKIVFLSMQEPDHSSPGALSDAEAGCTVRQTCARELMEMVRGSCPDRIATSLELSHPQASLRRDPQRSSGTLFPQERPLTSREREVLKLLAEGKTVRAAASVLGLSSKTVDAHKFNLMRKLGIHNKAELVMWAIRKRVVKIPANF